MVTAAVREIVRRSRLEVRFTADFQPDGRGTAREWNRVAWTPLGRITTRSTSSLPTAVACATSASPISKLEAERPAVDHPTLFKCLYSEKALYLLFDCEDDWITAEKHPFNGPIWTGDSVEFFLWPNAAMPLYFQYGISPLGSELALLVPNDGHSHFGWAPWWYEGARRVIGRTEVRGGPQRPRAAITGWTAEVRLPFALLAGLVHEAPPIGAEWRANAYRVDYRGSHADRWAWCPDTGEDTHAFKQYGTLAFAD